jgi:dCMP deaminase
MNSKWHSRFLKLAHEIASWSKDNSSKVGSVIVDDDRTPRSFGYNGFPRGVDDNVPERQNRPLKIKFSTHAEQNALNHCAKHGIAVDGCTIFVTHHPCDSCSRSIIGSGIKTVIVDEASLKSEFAERWKDDIAVAQTMFKEAGVELILVNLNS